MSSEIRKLTRREVRENSAVGSDSMVAVDALSRIRWDPAIDRKTIKLGISLFSSSEVATCRCMFRPSHTCKFGEHCQYAHVIKDFHDKDLSEHERSYNLTHHVTIIRQIDFSTFTRLCTRCKLTPTLVVYIKNHDAVIWNAFGKDQNLWPSRFDHDEKVAEGISLDVEIPVLGIDCLPEAALQTLLEYCDDRSVAALNKVNKSVAMSLQWPSIWAALLLRHPAFQAAQLAGRVNIESSAMVPEPMPSSTFVEPLKAHGLFFDAANSHHLNNVYNRLARTWDWAQGVRSMMEIRVIEAMELTDAVSRAVSKEIPATPIHAPSKKKASSSPAASTVSAAQGARRSLVTRFQRTSEEEYALAHEIDSEIRSRSVTDDDTPSKNSSRSRPSPAASAIGRFQSQEVIALRRLLRALFPLPCDTPFCAEETSEAILLQMRLRRRMCRVRSLLFTVFRSMSHEGLPTLAERAAAEELADMIEAELADSLTASLTDAFSSTDADATVQNEPPFWPHNSLHICRPQLRVKDCSGLIGSSDSSGDTSSNVGVFTGLGAVRIGRFGAASGTQASIKTMVAADDRVVAVDKAGGIKVYSADGNRIAAGKASGLSSSALSLGGDTAIGSHGRCCAAVCSVDHADNMVATGHPDGSVLISMLSGSQAMRAGVAFRFEESTKESGRARSGSSQATAHTTVAFLEHGTQLLVGRRNTKATAKFGGSLTLYSSETGDVIQNTPLSGFTDTALPQLPNTIKAISPTTVVVGMSDGSIVVWDARTGSVVKTATITERTIRHATPEIWAPASGYAADLNLPVPEAHDGAPSLVDEVIAQRMRQSRGIHVPGTTSNSWYDRPVDAACSIMHLHAHDNLVLESRASPIMPVIGDPASAFVPSASPFVRTWDLRASTTMPFHVIDLGPKCLMDIKGLYFDADKLLIAHQHAAMPVGANHEALAEAALAAPMLHWNLRDRPRAVARNPPTTGRLWHQLLQSDIVLPLIPEYVWPPRHAPPALICPADTATHLYGTAMRYNGSCSAQKYENIVERVYGRCELSCPEPFTPCDESNEEGRSPIDQPIADDATPTPLTPEPTVEQPAATEVGGERFPAVSGVTVWHPHTLSHIAYLPVPLVTCLAASTSMVAIGTESAALYWHTAAVDSRAKIALPKKAPRPPVRRQRGRKSSCDSPPSEDSDSENSVPDIF